MLNRGKHNNEPYIWLEVCFLFKVEEADKSVIIL